MMTRNRLLTGSVVALLALPALTGCGAKSSAAAPAQSSQQGQQQGGSNGNGYGRMPGVRGTVAEVDGSTVQVQSSSSQTAVTLGASTKVRLLNSVSSSALKAGECVQVTSPRTSGSQSSSPSATATGSPTTVTAGTVVITPATNGSCTTGTGRTNASARPSSSWTPTGNGSGGTGGYGGYGRGANGMVTAVQGSAFTVQQTRQGTTSTVSVDTTSSTTYQQQVAGTKAAVKVGQCLTAMGQADSTGTVAATQVVVSAPVNGSCSTGYGRGNR